MTDILTCDMTSYMTDQNGIDRYWRCGQERVHYCCGSYYCDDCFDVYRKNNPHTCYCCEGTGIVVNKIGLINVGQACVLCEGDI